jgi:hypothetical protein
MRCAQAALCLLAVVIAGAFFRPPAFGAERVGRFFHTPEERAILDGLRSAERAAPPLPSVSDAGLTESVVSFQGIVLRSSGRQTIWLNDRLYHENEIPPGIKAPGWSQRDRMSIELTGSSGVFTVKPGEVSVMNGAGQAEMEK